MRLKPKVVVDRKVRNQSSRAGVKPRLIVLHSTEGWNYEGTADLEGLAAWFDNPAANASSHVATDADGHSARFVVDDRRAWHVAAYNDASLGIEQIGFASQNKWAEAELKETARWIAKWSLKHDIPIQHGRASNGQVRRAGVVCHSELGAEGGGHSDPGRGYPMGKVLDLAREFKREVKRL